MDSIYLIDAALFGVVGLGVWYYFRRRSHEQDFRAYLNDIVHIENPTADKSHQSLYDKMKSSGRTMVVFYGSQTGTAEEFASRIAREALRFGIKALVADPEDCNLEDISKLSEIENAIAIFCLATYGEGDPTDNAQGLFEWLTAGEADLGRLNYAVFGLGNRTYEHFNAMGYFADQKLADMSGVRICDLGLGDDDGNIEDDFIKWKEELWNEISVRFHVHESANFTNLRQYELTLHDKDSISEEKIFTGEVSRVNSYRDPRPPFGIKNPYLSEVVKVRELYRGERSCLHVEFSMGNAMMAYDTGDHLVVFPENDPALVDTIGQLLNVDLDQVITLTNVDPLSTRRHPFPCPCSYRTALTYYVDLTSLPRMHTLRDLCGFVSTDEDREFLTNLSNSDEAGKAKYNKWVVENCRNIVHILQDISSLRPPMDMLLELMPRLQPRYYSISSSSLVSSRVASITAVVVEYKTPTDRISKGVATGFLKRKLHPNNGEIIVDVRLPICFVRSQFKLPKLSEDGKMPPIIMIGPGTGLAPMRGFLHELEHLKLTQNKTIGDVVLYYGCRNKDQDYLYQDELERLKSNGTLTHLRVAFSRDQPEKIYVTHLLKQNLDETWEIIDKKGGYIYVCGEARNMAKEVHQILLDNIKQNIRSKPGLDQASDADIHRKAEEYFKNLETKRRYQTDVWS